MDEPNKVKKVLVFGARSDLGFFLLPSLIHAGWSVFAFTRNLKTTETCPGVTWISSDNETNPNWSNVPDIPFVISLMPIWALPTYQDFLRNIRATFLIAFSSTSVIAKKTSSDSSERMTAELLENGETWVVENFCLGQRSALIFRPTMIYGGPYNRNVNRIRTLVKNLRFFVLTGDGKGLRQPVHAEDLSNLCVRSLGSPPIGTNFYTLVGGQTLTYREMINIIFENANLKPRIVSMPLDLFRYLLPIVKILSNQKDITLEMINRMEIDLCYSDDEAVRKLAWNPRNFMP